MPTTAYFDFDGTLLHGDSDVLFHRHAKGLGRMTEPWRRAMRRMMGDYEAGILTLDTFRRFLRERVRGWTPVEFEAEAARCFHARAKPALFPEARGWLAWHRARGHRVVILSAGSHALIAEAGRYLEVDAAYGCAMEVRGGAFTGAAREPLPFAAGKIAVARADGAAAASDLCGSYFYSDSQMDLPLLRAVGHAVVVHPDATLAAEAAARGWRRYDPVAPVRRG